MREVGPSTDLVVATPQAVTVGMRIFVSACAGAPVQLDVPASATLDDVLATVQGMVRLHPRDQLRWLYGGRFLEGALTLASHGIQAGATLHLILAGGAAVMAQHSPDRAAGRDEAASISANQAGVGVSKGRLATPDDRGMQATRLTRRS